MTIVKNTGYSDAYDENSTKGLPATPFFRKNRKEALAGKKGKSKINRSEIGLKVVALERYDEMRLLDESMIVTNMFCSLSKDNQLALHSIIESFIRLPASKQSALCAIVESFAKLPEDKQTEISSFVKYLERGAKREPSDPSGHIQPDITKSKSGVQQRPKGERTERTNLSFPPLLKDALTRAAEKQNKSVSLYVSDVLSKQPEVTQELSA